MLNRLKESFTHFASRSIELRVPSLGSLNTVSNKNKLLVSITTPMVPRGSNFRPIGFGQTRVIPPFISNQFLDKSLLSKSITTSHKGSNLILIVGAALLTAGIVFYSKFGLVQQIKKLENYTVPTVRKVINKAYQIMGKGLKKTKDYTAEKANLIFRLIKNIPSRLWSK